MEQLNGVFRSGVGSFTVVGSMSQHFLTDYVAIFNCFNFGGQHPAEFFRSISKIPCTQLLLLLLLLLLIIIIVLCPAGHRLNLLTSEFETQYSVYHT